MRPSDAALRSGASSFVYPFHTCRCDSSLENRQMNGSLGRENNSILYPECNSWITPLCYGFFCLKFWACFGQLELLVVCLFDMYLTLLLVFYGHLMLMLSFRQGSRVLLWFTLKISRQNYRSSCFRKRKVWGGTDVKVFFSFI